MTSTFEQDLAFGIAEEVKVLDVIQSKYPCAVKIEGKFKGYDLFIPEINKSIEVKSDIKSNETGNIVIEVEMSGVPSALITSKADYWVFSDGKQLIVMSLRRIKDYILLNNPPLKLLKPEGDKNPKKAYLLKKVDFFKHGKLLQEAL